MNADGGKEFEMETAGHTARRFEVDYGSTFEPETYRSMDTASFEVRT